MPPMYTYECEPCRRLQTDMKKIDERHEAPLCRQCSQQMKLVLSATPGIVRDPAVPRRNNRAK